MFDFHHSDGVCKCCARWGGHTCTHTLGDIKSEFLSNRYWQGKTQSGTHAHTRLDYLLSVSVITDLTSFLHVKADKPFVHARAHTHKFCTPPSVSSDGNCWRARRWPAGEILIGALREEEMGAPSANPVSSKDKCVGVEYLSHQRAALM